VTDRQTLALLVFTAALLAVAALVVGIVVLRPAFRPLELVPPTTVTVTVTP
jgi:hypothetical protein